MNKRIFRKPNMPDVENILIGALRPVTPRPEFVQHLRRRLQDTTIPSVKVPTMVKSHMAILITASVLGSLLVVLTNSRAIISLISTLGALFYLRRQMQQKRSVTVRPAL